MSYHTQQKLIEYFSDSLAECCDEKTHPEVVVAAFLKALDGWVDYHAESLDYLERLRRELGKGL